MNMIVMNGMDDGDHWAHQIKAAVGFTYYDSRRLSFSFFVERKRNLIKNFIKVGGSKVFLLKIKTKKPLLLLLMQFSYC